MKPRLRIGMFSLLFCLLLMPLLLSTVVRAQEDMDLDAVLEGFEEGEEAASPDREAGTGGTGEADDLDAILEGFDSGEEAEADLSGEGMGKPSLWNLDGYFKFGTAYNFAQNPPEPGETDWRGFSKLRSELQLDLNLRFSRSWRGLISGKGTYDAIYDLRGEDEFTAEITDEYETEFEFREIYVSGTLADDLDIKAGRQIVVWGKSDNIRVTDVLNPLDMREPGLTDIEDLRLPVAMTRLDYYFGDWNLTGIAIHEIRFNKEPVYGSDLYPGEGPRPPERVPEDGFDNTEWALSLSGIFSGWDMDLYYARIYNDRAHAVRAVTPEGPGVALEHARLHMIGGAYNIALGNWLVKAEAAYFDGISFFNRPDAEYSRLDTLLGVEYSGFTETVVSFEAANRHGFDFDSDLEGPPDYAAEDEFQWAARLTRDYLHDTLTLTLLASVFGPAGEDGAFERIALDYDLNDRVNIRGGAVLYQSGDLYRFREIGESDRLFFEVKYSF